ncbi:hypothetical protein GH741_11380 [Aquibacillus halophilus]|uniref:Cxxc_20_cxxc protein n=1 Tax=Aquibacillus halophilus TaxID=930132 RepID=A0A6A8DHS5_9BACI|nr:hypothetical protein [Aquibacillus halophilus]
MQKCEKCQHKFKWLEVLKSFLRFEKTYDCSICGTEHWIETTSKIIVALFYSLAPIIGFSLGQTKPSLIIFIVVLAYPLLIFLLSPFLYRFNSKYRANHNIPS